MQKYIYNLQKLIEAEVCKQMRQQAQYKIRYETTRTHELFQLDQENFWGASCTQPAMCECDIHWLFGLSTWKMPGSKMSMHENSFHIFTNGFQN